MAYTTGLNLIGPSTSGNHIWQYTTTDTAAVVSASGYFNAAAANLINQDVIMVFGPESVPTTYIVSSADGAAVVTTTGSGAYSLDSGVPGQSVNIIRSMPGGATVNRDLVITNKVRINGVTVQLAGAGSSGDTIQVKTAAGASNITNAIDISSAVSGQLVSATNIDPNQGVVAAGATVRFAAVDGGGSNSPACFVILNCTLVV